MPTRRTKNKKTKHKRKLKGRERRLEKAPQWVVNHSGNPANMLKRYRKSFAVDWECAIAELTDVGVEFNPRYLSRLRASVGRDFAEGKKYVPISGWEFDRRNGIEQESGETFPYIAGYTGGGFPFGITWEEFEKQGSKNSDFRDHAT